ncbi:MAG: dihydrolipoyl dehydrogenase [Verrucomicrobia bacterium]|nr:dihydrolipoyl dehydrogenase [Verrucomicrobiota bacterium]
MQPIQTDIVVLGGGPGGYAAAFYAADKGRKVLLVEQEERLGGVCLNWGCIPSKTYLHAAKLLTEARESIHRGITFGEPKIDLNQLRTWKNSIVEKLGQGITGLARTRGVEVLHGRGYFEDSKLLRVETSTGQKFFNYDHVIVATGSRAAIPKAFDLGNPRIMTSTEALEVPDIPSELLVVGGGYIGMELGTVYATLGSRVTVVEALPAVLSGADPDLARPVLKYVQKAFKEVRVSTKVLTMATAGRQIKVVSETGGQQREELYDRVLVSVGRLPNTVNLGLENTQVTRDDKGYIEVDAQQKTSDPLIYAIGDVAGGALLAHKASREGRVAVDAIGGELSTSEDQIIPAVVFTDPEIAWCGITEMDAKQKGVTVQVVKFPWTASGRAMTFDRPDGVTKLVIEPESERVLGVGITGHGAGELIGEGVLAVEMGATARDLAECTHPHPTLSETLQECAEVFYGCATHVTVRNK